jgi:flagellar hook assembly protein FlgD
MTTTTATASGHAKRLASLAVCAHMFIASSLTSQTFVQLSDLGQGVGRRLTRSDTRSRLDRDLFGAIGTKVSFIDNSIVYQFATDPDWRRVLVGRLDEWVHSFDNAQGPGGALRMPLGIDISARKYVYAADWGKGAILLTQFSPGAQNLVNPEVWMNAQFPRPVDVSWDGSSTPLTTDNLYVLDDSLKRVSYWDFSNRASPNLLWSYGTSGNGPGQFSRPSGICVGKTVGANGGTQFTTQFYVVDRGSRRVAWLTRGSNGATWSNSVSIADWDPADCAVDHFGNVYVVDEANNRLHKFTYALGFLATYGSFGKGEANANTFAWPHAVSVPCGLKTVNSQTVWYCEGRVITAEQWSDSSGAVEHYLNFEFTLTAGPDTSTKVASIAYRTTDHTRQWVRVIDWNSANVRWLATGTLTPPGTIGRLWDGRRDDGTWAPPGNYRFRIDVESAYGCGASWCHTTAFTSTFWSNGNSECGPPPPPQTLRAGGDSVLIARKPCLPQTFATEPTTLFMHQSIVVSAEPLARISGINASVQAGATSTGSASLSDLVRQHGVRGLRFGITPEAAGNPVSIRIYSLGGRLVRVLVNEQLAAGFYELGWDGRDDRGAAAVPGVYFAVLSAGGQRLMQRLILRQP